MRQLSDSPILVPAGKKPGYAVAPGHIPALSGLSVHFEDRLPFTVPPGSGQPGFGDAQCGGCALWRCAVAAMGIIGRISMFVISAVLGFGQDFQPVVGYNYGARQYTRVRQAFSFTVKVGTLALVILAAAGYLFAPAIIAVFRRDDPQVIAIGAHAFRAQCLALPLQALVIMTNMLLQGTGHAASATFTSSARQGLFFLPFVLILPAFMGLPGIQIAQPLADAATFVCCIPLVARFFRRLPMDAPLAQGDIPSISPGK